MLKEGGVASSQKIHQGRCFTFIKGQRDNCLYSEMNLPVFYIPWQAGGGRPAVICTLNFGVSSLHNLPLKSKKGTWTPF